jgi:hypothetical protein
MIGERCLLYINRRVCQMVYFQYQFWYVLEGIGMTNLVYFIANLNLNDHLGMLYGNFDICILSHLGLLCIPRKIWKPYTIVRCIFPRNIFQNNFLNCCKSNDALLSLVVNAERIRFLLITCSLQGCQMVYFLTKNPN